MSRAILDKLQHEAAYFAESELASLEAFARFGAMHGADVANRTVAVAPLGRIPHVDSPTGRTLEKVSTQIARAITKIKYLRLRNELRELTNAQINEDQIVLAERMQRLHFGAD